MTGHRDTWQGGSTRDVHGIIRGFAIAILIAGSAFIVFATGFLAGRGTH